jgi:plasmid stabilization system protein ParE
MTRYAVVLSPRAQQHVAVIHAWWLENRSAAPTLFIDEIGALESELADGNLTGTAYALDPPARRVLLQRCRYHVYYEIDEARGVVQVLAVWHASRGRGPAL